jgi:hypothetical protein
LYDLYYKMLLHKCAVDGCNENIQKWFKKCFEHGGWNACEIDGCYNTAVENNIYANHNKIPGVEPSYNNIHRQGITKCAIHGDTKVCIEPGCNNKALVKTHKCKLHSRIVCIEPGCNNTAEKKHNKCTPHINQRWCNTEGCDKIAHDIYNYCINHFGIKCKIPWCENRIKSTDTRCSIHKKTCIVFGCTNNKYTVYNTCIEHGGGQRCVVMGCNKIAINKYDQCIDHRFGKKCIEPGCSYNSIGITHRCARHGGGYRCKEPNCNKLAAVGSYKCTTHGGGKRCPNCIDWIDSRFGLTKYDGYCVTCFKHLFPDDPRSRKTQFQSKELMVRSFINEHFDGFIHNIPLYTGNCDCTHRRRIDHRKLFGNTILAIETDEFGHRGYDAKDEEIRYDDVYMIHSGKWIFIRFNPDNNVSKVDIEDKLAKLKETIYECINRIENEDNTELVEIIKLFY